MGPSLEGDFASMATSTGMEKGVIRGGATGLLYPPKADLVQQPVAAGGVARRR